MATSHCCLSVDDCIVIPASSIVLMSCCLHLVVSSLPHGGLQPGALWTLRTVDVVHCEYTVYYGDEHTLLLKGGTDGQPAYFLSKRNKYVFCHHVCYLFALVCCGRWQDADSHMVAIMPV